MKIAVVYNRESENVINLFGQRNREKYGLKAIKRITNALKKGGHQVMALEGDKALIPRLEEFIPKAVKGERPGMVFNLSYGIQGQARYTHVPGILEMVGIPYVGSGPLAHSLALDKVVAKMIFRQNGLPTPDFAVMLPPTIEVPGFGFPMIVKPKNESTSFGLTVVNDEEELKNAVELIYEQFGQPVLVEEFIEGRELNVGILGNNPPETFPPAEVHFDEGPSIYTREDKSRKSGREIRFTCPADIDAELASTAQSISVRAFQALGCFDCARIDLRVDSRGEPFILEVNSLPSLGEHGSYVMAADTIGLDFAGLINRLVDVAATRYFGTARPPRLTKKKSDAKDFVFSFVTDRRDQMEKRLRQWSSIHSRSSDPIGLKRAFKEMDRKMRELDMVAVAGAADEEPARLWQTEAGFRDGTLILAQLDVPIGQNAVVHYFRKEPEWLYGEGIGTSRGGLVQLETALQAVRAEGKLDSRRIGVLVYGDEKFDCRYTSDLIRASAAKASRVLVLRPCNRTEKLITGRRGLRKYRLVVEGESVRLGQTAKKGRVMAWLHQKLAELTALTNNKSRIGVAAVDLKTQAWPLKLAHWASVTILVSYPNKKTVAETESRIREIIGKPKLKCSLDRFSDRPPMPERAGNTALARSLEEAARRWDIPLQTETSVLPSVAGLVPQGVPVLCGLGPSADDIHTPEERISRISLIHRTLMLAELLLGEPKGQVL